MTFAPSFYTPDKMLYVESQSSTHGGSDAADHSDLRGNVIPEINIVQVPDTKESGAAQGSQKRRRKTGVRVCVCVCFLSAV
jgi:hypothetical protein